MTHHGDVDDFSMAGEIQPHPRVLPIMVSPIHRTRAHPSFEPGSISLKDGAMGCILIFLSNKHSIWYTGQSIVDNQLFIDGVRNHKDVQKALSDSHEVATGLRGIGHSVY